MTDTVLCIDIGTTSLKAGIINATGEVVSVSTSSYKNPDDRYIANFWLPALKFALEDLFSHVKNQIQIKAIAVSGNGPTLVLDNGFTFRWNEENLNENSGVKEFSLEEVKKSLFLPRILSFKHKFTKEFEESKYIFSGPEFFIYKLTANAITILPEERYTKAYWSTQALEKCNLNVKKFPSFVSLGANCGLITENIAEYLNLPKNIPVFAGGPDFIAALIGTNTISPGRLCDRSGSSEGFNFCVSKAIFAPGLRSLPSIKKDLWNISVLIPESGSLSIPQRLEKVSEAINFLRKIAIENKIPFPDKMLVTGGQTKDKSYMKLKEEKLKLKLISLECGHSELIGDACLAFLGLGKFSNLQEACDILTNINI